jgi:hypothetical protein
MVTPNRVDRFSEEQMLSGWVVQDSAGIVMPVVGLEPLAKQDEIAKN